MNSDMSYRGGREGGRAFSGLLFLAAGILLLLDNLNVIQLRPTLIQYWPVLLMIIGVKHLIFWRGPAAWISAAFWISTGLLFLAASLGYINVAWGALLWPVLLIWFGVSMAVGPRGGCGGAPVSGDRS